MRRKAFATWLASPAPTLFLALFAAQAGVLSLTPILPDLARDLGVSTATAGGLRVLSGLAGGVTALVLVRVWRRLDLRDLIRLGALLVCVGSLFGAAAPSFPLLAAAQVALGAGVAATLSGGVAAAAEWSRPSERSRMLSWALVGQPASWVVCMPVIGVLSDLGWRAALIFPAVAALTALIAVSGRPAEGASPPSASLRAALRGRPVVAGWATGELLAYAGWGGTLVFAGALMVESYGASVGLTGAILGAGALAYFPGNFIARRYVDSRSQQLLVALGIAMAAGVVLFGACRPALWLSGLLFAMLVLLAGGRAIAGSAFGLDAAPEHKVALMSIRAAATQFGYLVGAGLGGLALAAGGYSLLGVVLATLFALAVLPYLCVTPGSLGERASPPGSSTRPLRATAVRVGRSAGARSGACFATRLQYSSPSAPSLVLWTRRESPVGRSGRSSSARRPVAPGLAAAEPPKQE